MPEIIYLLQADGEIEELAVEKATLYQVMDGETDPAAIGLADIQAEPLVIAFNGVADGRGFSLVKAVRQDLGYRGRVYASGFLNPDQLSFALQCGFDGVLVNPERWETYSAEVWRSALNPLVNLSYSLTESRLVRSVWQRRHGIDSSPKNSPRHI